MAKHILRALAATALFASVSLVGLASAADAQTSHHACPNPTWTAYKHLTFVPGYNVAFVNIPNGLFGLGASFTLTSGQGRFDTYSITQNNTSSYTYYYIDYMRNQSGNAPGWFLANYC